MSDAPPPYPAATEPGGPRRDRPASLARRVVPAVAVLGAAGGLLVLLDHPGGSGAPDEAAGVAGTADPTATGGGVGLPSTTVPPAGGSTSRSTTTTVPAAPTCTPADTVTGDAVTTRYGPVQVEATVSADGSICTIDALQVPSHDRRSVSINQRAVPTLTQRALAAGDTDFDAVSGATISSNAYKRSLQSILDQL